VKDNSQNLLKEHQMDDKTKATLTNLDTWKRGLFMVMFVIISGVAKLLVAFVAIFQFITVLFKGQTNEAVNPFGQSLSTYIYQITMFLTFNTEDMPFPFRDFPDGTAAAKPREKHSESVASTETTNNNEVETIDSSEPNEDGSTGRNSKDDPLIV
jgi:hypothetical protein